MDSDARPPRKKAPRRTAERIQAVALDLFNRRGEPHVSTQMLSAELHISPGNLHYHYPAKADLVNALYDHFEVEHATLLAEPAAAGPDALLAWLMELHRLIWDYRFLFRDMGDLLTRNRHIESHLPKVMAHQQQAVAQRLHQRCGDATTLAVAVHLTLNQWVSHEYLVSPRHALDNEQALAVEARVRAQLAGLLALARLGVNPA